MPLTLRLADPREAPATDLLVQSHTLMAALFPPEENYALDVDALSSPHIRFWLAEDGGIALGCAALALLDGYGEVKSMFVAPAARGKGVARALLNQIEQAARAHGLPLLRLETGAALTEAVRLYEATGFVPCGPFGAYEVNQTSLFYERAL